MKGKRQLYTATLHRWV